VFGKIFTAFTLQVYTHFLNKKPFVLIGEFFQRKAGSYFLFKSVLAFQPKYFYFTFLFSVFFS